MNILFSFIQYVVIAIILAVCAFGGLMIGKSIRQKKNLKNQQEAE